MVWSADAPPRAIAAPNVGADALTSVPVVEALGDLLAAAHEAGAGALVSYDDGGGYGHPDHVHAHRLARAGAHALELPFWEIRPRDLAGHDLREEDESVAETLDIDISPWCDRKVAALRCHGTQLRVDGDDLVHVGGQRERITRVESYRLRS